MSNYTPAMESVFADADQSAQVILDAVRAGIDTKITTVEDAQTLYLDLSKEAAKFNECLRAISNLSAQLDAGNIDKEEAVASISPYVKELKDNCTALKIAGTKTTIDDNDITEEEIAILREVITGAMSIAEHHVREMQSKVIDYKDGEPPATESTGILASIATEASVVGKIRQSTEAKTAKELYKQAKRLYSMGSKEKAKEYLTKAQKLYEACLKKVMKEGKFFQTERTEGLAAGLTGGLTATDRYKATVSNSMSDVTVRAYFEDRIDACRALMLQWTNKAGAKTFAETKAQLKAERKSEKASIRAAKKEAKEKAKADKAAAKTSPADENWLDFANESVSESLLDFELEAALEAMNDDCLDGECSTSSEGTSEGSSDEDENLEDLATEAAIAVMLAEDGIVD